MFDVVVGLVRALLLRKNPTTRHVTLMVVAVVIVAAVAVLIASNSK